MQKEQRTFLLCDTMRLILRFLVDDPNAIEVSAHLVEGAGTTIEIVIAKCDLGRLIGKRGRMAEALREYVRAYEQQHGGTYHIVVRGNAD